jgi:hypothetical protein
MEGSIVVFHDFLEVVMPMEGSSLKYVMVYTIPMDD